MSYKPPVPRRIPIVENDFIIILEAIIGLFEELKGVDKMAIYSYMVAVYAQLVKAERRTIESLPFEYQIVVAEYLAAEAE